MSVSACLSTTVGTYFKYVLSATTIPCQSWGLAVRVFVMVSTSTHSVILANIIIITMTHYHYPQYESSSVTTIWTPLSPLNTMTTSLLTNRTSVEPTYHYPQYHPDHHHYVTTNVNAKVIQLHHASLTSESPLTSAPSPSYSTVRSRRTRTAGESKDNYWQQPTRH